MTRESFVCSIRACVMVELALIRNISPVDRFFQSAYDFRTGRPWPPIASGLNNLWDQVLFPCN